ncbi:hypothetical protein TNCV_3039611 [Trichonephila clavipes]|uniref:Uncharacterized protein n=1 Tax=Trichonephila clavipes TaxID=2585209 RepID=A0A8X6RY14_TRICX|nr:hypothetical protein TNCV_3039611 [Trichonephila clavipes]
MFVCGKEFRIACMHSKGPSFEDTGRGSQTDQEEGEERLRAAALHVRTCGFCDHPQFVANRIVHDPE